MRAHADPEPDLRVGDHEFPYDPDVHGWTIKTTATDKISVCILLFHYRVTITRHHHPHTWDHGWCYSAHEDRSRNLLYAVAAAVSWKPDVEPEPFGWSKRACHCEREIP